MASSKDAVVMMVVVAPAVMAALACAPKAADAAGGEKRVDRGRYLVSVMACGDCHTPLTMGPNGPQPDQARFLSGHPESVAAAAAPALSSAWAWAGAPTNTAFAGPWGVSYTANLTPDRNTGLGGWTEKMFVDAIRTGRHMGTSRPIAPPMPWPAYGTATDEDLRAIFAYLQTITPIVNHVPDYQPPVATH